MKVGKFKDEAEALQTLAEAYRKIKSEIHKVIIGQDEIIDQLLISLFSRGHCLIVGVPGLAKTMLISTLAEVLDLEFSRIQFTPDLMPSDITGTEILEEDQSSGKKSFRYIKGPIFANIVLADEINRTPPKTQAALLESMQEHKVTAAGKSYPLDEPFFVLATQNPIEQEGTYPLPEAQLDRFMFNLWITYPDLQEEIAIVKQTTGFEAPQLQRVVSREEILAFQEAIRQMPVADNVVQYAVRLVRQTRPDGKDSPEYIRHWVNWGAGPRASQYLIIGAKTRAALLGRFTPEIEDVQFCAVPVLRHRIVANFNAEAEGVGTLEIIEKLLQETPLK
ncbi:MAG: MoxR family ATPase [Calditrichia bacterium]